MSQRAFALRSMVTALLHGAAAAQAVPGASTPSAASASLSMREAAVASSVEPLAQAASAPLAASPPASAPALAPSAAPASIPASREQRMAAFAQQAAQRRGLDADWVLRQLRQANYSARVAQLVMPPQTPTGGGSAKDWDAYRNRMVDRRRVVDGVTFWRTHAQALARAQARWGVPPSIVVAIVGIETYYGRITGGFRVLDALTTLAFDFPAGRRDRSGFFKDELEAYLSWCQREGRDPASVLGSYAGAIGLPQFMPSSILKYAVDFDGDGHIELAQAGDDVIGSVAHYFAEFGWTPDMPTYFSVTAPVATTDLATLVAPDIRPTFSPEQMIALGAGLEPAARTFTGLLAMVELQRGQRAPTYVAGTPNFYVVTRYNWSAYYAMAVIELAAQIERERFAAAR